MKFYRLMFIVFVCACALTVNAHEYSHSSCEYVISFPSAPTLVNMNADNLGSYEVANWNGDKGAFLRAECIYFGENGSNLKNSLLESMKVYVAANGLTNASYEAGFDDLGHFVDVRAYKIVAGIMATFRIRSYAGKWSYLSLQAAAPSEIYPTREIINFFPSIRAKQ